jgi:hypothetical protein
MAIVVVLCLGGLAPRVEAETRLGARVAREVSKYKEFAAAKKEVGALVKESPELAELYKSTFAASRRSDGSRSLDTAFTVGGGFATAVGLKAGGVAAVAHSPLAPVALAAGGAHLLVTRSSAHANARLAVIGAALAKPELREKLSPESVSYFSRLITPKIAANEAQLKNAETQATTLRESLAARKAQLELVEQK